MKILWIDDDRLFTEPLCQDMQDKGHEVNLITRVDDAFDQLIKSPASYDAIVLDVMLPARGIFKTPEAKGGLRTGLVFLTKAAELGDEILQKILVLTVVGDPEVREFCVELDVNLMRKQSTTSDALEDALLRKPA